METVINYLNQNWIGVALGVVALAYAFYEGNKNRGPRLAYQYLGQQIIGSSTDLLPDKLLVTYDGDEVNNLSLTRVVLWNKGNSPLREEDIPEADSIKIAFAGSARVLRSEVSKTTREINKIKIDSEPGFSNFVTIRFGFLDSGDGTLISIWHTAENVTPIVTGTIIGQKTGPVSFGRFLWRGREPLKKDASPLKKISRTVDSTITPVVMTAMLVLTGTVFICFASLEHFAGIKLLRSNPDSDFNKFWFPLLFGSFNILFGIWSMRKFTRRFPKQLMPEDYLPRDSSNGDDSAASFTN